MKYIEDVKSEKDLGVIFEANLKWTKQISACVNKANSLLGMLLRTFESRDVNIWKHLYISMVRPHLEYAFQVWSPTLESDISKLEKIQRRATKIPTALKNMSYDDRLKTLGLTTLEERRKRGDLICMFKITKGYESICWENSQVQSDRASRKQNLKRESFSSKRSNDFCREVSVRHNFFINRVIPDWNNMPSKIVSAPSINSFKARLDMIYKNGCYSTKPMI